MGLGLDHDLVSRAERAEVEPVTARRFTGVQVIGARARQEDDFAMHDLSDGARDRYLFAVADGMGGHEGAAAVAQVAVRRFCEIVRNAPALSLRLRDALAGANEAVALAGIQN